MHNAIGNYFHAAGEMLYNHRYHDVSVVFALLKKNLPYPVFNVNGDLSRIIQIAENNTGIHFARIDFKQILKKIAIEEVTKNLDKTDSHNEILKINHFYHYYDISYKIQQLGNALQAECNSRWPYPNKPLKLIKLEALSELGDRLFNNLEDLEEVVSDIKQKWPQIMDGVYSTRTKALFDLIESIIRDEHKKNAVTLDQKLKSNTNYADVSFNFS